MSDPTTRISHMADGVCSIEGCSKPANCRTWCKGHYYRWSRYGDPAASAAPRPPRPPKVRDACTVNGCDRPIYGRGWCEPHYARWRRHGDLDDVRSARRDPLERFEEKVDRSDADGCHLWTGPPNGAGYGWFNLDGRVIGAHVAAVILSGGEVPPGFEPDHLCRRPMCVRLEHLEVVTAAENKRRARASA